MKEARRATASSAAEDGHRDAGADSDGGQQSSPKTARCPTARKEGNKQQGNECGALERHAVTIHPAHKTPDLELPV
jgi:hypothetical protein